MVSVPAERLPPAGRSSPRRAENLLDQIAETALDDDYYLVRSGERPRRRTDVIVWGVALVLTAGLITVAAVQGRAARPSNDLEQRTLAADIEQRREVLTSRRATVEALRDQVSSLQAPDADADKVKARRIQTGAVATTGPGLVIEANDSAAGNTDGRVTARDLRLLVDGLWAAGAEAVTVNGHRLGALSAIVPLQGGVTVDYVRIAPPYRVAAIGNGDELTTRFREGPFGTYWSTRERNSGVRWSMTGSSKLQMSAAAQRRTSVSVAKPLKGDR